MVYGWVYQYCKKKIKNKSCMYCFIVMAYKVQEET